MKQIVGAGRDDRGHDDADEGPGSEDLWMKKDGLRAGPALPADGQAFSGKTWRSLQHGSRVQWKR